MSRQRKANLLSAVADGLAGGLAMLLFRSAWRRWTRGRAPDQFFGLDKDADITSVLVLADMAGFPRLSDVEAERWAIAFHLLLSAAGGLGFELLFGNRPGARQLAIVPFGIALWLFADEIPISIGGIDDPFRKSALGHGGALAAHILYAATLAATPSRLLLE